MGSVIENAKTKEKCQIFTPDDIVVAGEVRTFSNTFVVVKSRTSVK